MNWQLTEKARKRLAAETGAVVKDWGGRLRVALVFPNTYYVGMSNLGFQTIYGVLNRRPGHRLRAGVPAGPGRPSDPRAASGPDPEPGNRSGPSQSSIALRSPRPTRTTT